MGACGKNEDVASLQDMLIIALKGVAAYERQNLLDYANKTANESVDIEAVIGRCPRVITGEECYDILGGMGFQYGPSMRSLHTIYVGDDEVLSRLDLREDILDPM